MLSNADLVTVYDFVKTTGENNVRKMMTGPKMTATHVGLLFKVIRSTTSEEFAKHGEAGTFPRLKLNDAEAALKDNFWNVAGDTFVQLGLATPVKAAA